MTIHDTLAKARKYILHDRDCLYEGITLADGTIPNPDDAADLAEIDALLDEIDEALSAPTGGSDGTSID